MPERELETIRNGIDAYNRGDADALVALCDSDVCLKPVRALLVGGEYHGHGGARRFIADMEEDWSEREILVDETREASEDRVLVLGSYRAVGRASGTEIRHPLAWIVQFRDGLLLNLRAYTDTDEAQRAVASP